MHAGMGIDGGDPAAGAENEPSRKAIEQAAAWHARLAGDDVTEAVQRAFEHWRRGDPEHDRAWRRIEALWGQLAAAAVPGAHGAVEEAWRRESQARRRRLRHGSVGLLLAVALVPLAWLAGGLPSPAHLTADHYTAVGERAVVTLRDGSRLILGTGTALDVAFSEEQRRIRLHAGEIDATVADAPGRPFIVTTAEGHARALGTRFQVRRDQSTEEPLTRVTVRESTVKLCPALDPAAVCRRLGGGQQARTDGRRVTRPVAVNARAAAGWTRGSLVIDDRPIVEVLTELDRHRPGRVFHDRRALADIRVSGVLPLDDTDHALRALAAGHPIRVQTFSPWLVVVTRAD